MSTQPALFISHGSPMIALERDGAVISWQQLAQQLERPAAIVIVSGHWETVDVEITAASHLPTIHDFGGFPEQLYKLQYPAHGAPELAAQVAALLTAVGFVARLNKQRGLDHGAWIPLREMYPQSDIPIVQMSLQPQRDPDYHYRLGRALASLSTQNILVIGSGAITHNLRDWMQAMRGDNSALNYVPEFQQWIYSMLIERNLKALLDYRSVSLHGRRAHPSEEHLLPLFVALGVAGIDARITREYDSIANGVLGMDVYRFEPVG